LVGGLVGRLVDLLGGLLLGSGICLFVEEGDGVTSGTGDSFDFSLISSFCPSLLTKKRKNLFSCHHLVLYWDLLVELV